MKKLHWVLGLCALATVLGCEDFQPNDADGDGVEDAADLCPGSTGLVDETGCANNQQTETDTPAQLVRSPPVTGEVKNGLFPVVLDRDSASPHVFLVPEDDVITEGDEIRVLGDVSLATPGGFVVMHNAALTFDTTANTVGGTATIPLPGFGLFDDVSLEGTVQATVGYAAGSTLGALGVPLQPNRNYLHYNVITGGALIADDLELRTDGPGALVIIDPMDPAIFLSGSLLGLDKLGPLEDATLGFSLQGLIPFVPLVEPEGFEDFDGNLLVMGTLEIPALPITVVGDTTVAITGPLAGQQDALLGANGEFSLTQDLLGIPVLDIELFDATAIISLTSDGASADYDGEPSAATFATLPLAADLDEARGNLNDDEGGTFEAAGRFVIDGSFLSDLLIVPIPDIPLADASMLADADGVHVGGPLEGVLELPGVTVAGGAGAEATFQPDLSDWEIRLSGSANVAGEDLLDQVIIIDPTGVRVE